MKPEVPLLLLSPSKYIWYNVIYITNETLISCHTMQLVLCSRFQFVLSLWLQPTDNHCASNTALSSGLHLANLWKFHETVLKYHSEDGWDQTTAALLSLKHVYFLQKEAGLLWEDCFFSVGTHTAVTYLHVLSMWLTATLQWLTAVYNQEINTQRVSQF